MAVNNVSLEVQKGEIFGFLGPNAAGKIYESKDGRRTRRLWGRGSQPHQSPYQSFTH